MELTEQTIPLLPNYKPNGTSGIEFTAACPFCDSDDDGFHYWLDKKNWWCRKCNRKGFVGGKIEFDPDELRKFQERRKEELRKKYEKKLSKIELLNQTNNVSRYHSQLTSEAREWWHDQGITDSSINYWKLGYTTNCPTCIGHASFTIPITFQKKLYNIQHRLEVPNGSGKYRPEMAGLPNAIFNADVIIDPVGFSELVLVEGSKKAMVLMQNGFEAFGIPGAKSFRPKWVNLFSSGRTVYICLDPDQYETSFHIQKLLRDGGVEARVCAMPDKPDDLFTQYNYTSTQFFKLLKMGR